MGKPMYIRPLTRGALEKLSTPRLVAYLRRLHVVHETADWDDTQVRVFPSVIYSKDDPRWAELHGTVKSILATREHVA